MKSTRKQKWNTEEAKEKRKQEREAALVIWRKAKAYADANKDDVEKMINAVAALRGLEFSPYSFMFVMMQLAALNLSGTPYIDVNTFHGWKNLGRSVKPGEHSQIFSITWVSSSREADGADAAAAEAPEESRKYPKLTKLFHVSQTETDEERATRKTQLASEAVAAAG